MGVVQALLFYNIVNLLLDFDSLSCLLPNSASISVCIHKHVHICELIPGSRSDGDGLILTGRSTVLLHLKYMYVHKRS